MWVIQFDLSGVWNSLQIDQSSYRTEQINDQILLLQSYRPGVQYAY